MEGILSAHSRKGGSVFWALHWDIPVEVFPSRIPLEDVQSAWALLWHCAGERANYMLRAVRLEMVRCFVENHNAGLWAYLWNVVVDCLGLRDACGQALQPCVGRGRHKSNIFVRAVDREGC